MENGRNTFETLQKWWLWRHVLVSIFLLLYYPSDDVFHAVNIAIKQQQYCNTVRPQLSSDRLTQHMTSQTWRLERLSINESDSPLIRVTSMCNAYLYVYVSLIVLVYLCKLFYTSYSVFTIVFTIACPTVAIKSLFSIRHFAVDTCTPKRTYFYNLKRLYSGYLSEILWYKRYFNLMQGLSNLRPAGQRVVRHDVLCGPPRGSMWPASRSIISWPELM